MSQPPPFPENRPPTRSELFAYLNWVNRPQTRQKRPGQLPPSTRRGKRQSVSNADSLSDDGVDVVEEHINSAGQTGTDWGERMQQQERHWEARRQGNQHLAQAYAAHIAKQVAALTVEAAVRHATHAMGLAAALHSCCLFMEEAQCNQVAQQLAAQLFQEAWQEELAQGQDTQGPQQQPQHQHHQQDQAEHPQAHQQALLASLSVTSMRVVACHCMGASFWLPVPTLKCSCCNEEWELQAAGAGFFGSSPVQPAVWFSSQLLNLYSTLFQSGLSASSWCEGISTATSTATEQTCTGLPRTLQSLLPIDDRHFRPAWQQWQHVSQPWNSAAAVAASLGQQQLGPAACCPACAAVPPPAETEGHAGASGVGAEHTAASCLAGDGQAMAAAKAAGLLPGGVRMPILGPSGKPFLLAACFDANVKANRYKAAGRGRPATTTPGDGVFFADGHKKVWELKGSGQLPLSYAFSSSSSNGDGSGDGAGGTGGASPGAAGSAGDGDDAAIELDTHVQHQCHPHLSCARETSVSSAINDECGIAGGVCSHGVPLLGCMLAMPAPERMLYYDLLVSWLQTQADVNIMYLDIGCTYAAHWDRHMPGPPPSSIKVPWWHARGHGEGCFLKNSGFYMPGSGRRVGECCEQTWAQLRPVFKVLRFATTTGYQDGLELSLLGICEDKLQDAAQSNIAAERACRQKLKDSCQCIQQSFNTAAANGMQGPALVAAAVASMTPSSADQDMPEHDKLLMEYVRSEEQLRAQRSLQQNSSSLAVALPGTEHRALQARAQDKKLEDKLLRRVGQLQVALDLDEPLAVGSERYKKGLAALRDEQLRKTQRELEREVALLGSITQERRQEGEASKRTRNQQKRAARKRKRIRQLIDSMAAWQRMDLPSSSTVQQLPQQWGEQNVLALLKGSFPWRQGQDGGVSAVLVEQFRDACAEEARTLEELQMLQLERERIVAYYSFMQQQAAAAAATKLAAYQQQVAVVDQQLASSTDQRQAIVAMKEQMIAVDRLAVERAIMHDWSTKFERLKQSAVARFS